MEATEPSQVTIDMKEQTAETKEAAPVASAAVQTPAYLTAPEEPKKAETPKKTHKHYKIRSICGGVSRETQIRFQQTSELNSP